MMFSHMLSGFENEFEGGSDDGFADQSQDGASVDETVDVTTAAPPTSRDRILEQAEIDALMGGTADKVTHKKGIDVLLDSSTINHERLPMLEVVFDRLIKLLGTSLRNFTSDIVEVSLEDVYSTRFGDHLNAVELPALLGVFRAKEWESNPFILTINQTLIYTVIDALLGGRKVTAPTPIETRMFSAIERNLMTRLFQVILKEFSTAFSPITQVTFDFDRLETSPRFAMIARPANVSIVANFRIELNHRVGNIEFILPYSSLEPIRETLLQMFMGEKFGHDRIWETHLATEVWGTETTLTGFLGSTTLSLKDVLKWVPGTTVMLPTRAKDMVNVFAENVPVGNGHMGACNGHISIQMENFYLDLDKERKLK